MKIINLLLVILVSVNTLSGQNGVDKIIKKDKTSISGKVLRVTSENVEIDPEGDIPFLMIKRSDISVLIYADNSVVSFNDEQGSTLSGVKSNISVGINNESIIELKGMKLRTDGVYWGKVEGLKNKINTYLVIRFVDKKIVKINTDFWIWVIEFRGKETFDMTNIEANKDLYSDTWIYKLYSSGNEMDWDGIEYHVTQRCYYDESASASPNSISCGSDITLIAAPPTGELNGHPIASKIDAWGRSKPINYTYFLNLNPNQENATNLTGRFYKFFNSELREKESGGIISMEFVPLYFPSKK